MMTEAQAIDFCKNNPEAAAKIILMVDRLEQRVKELEDQLGLNSSNSSKPPSTDNKLTKAKKPSKSKKTNKRGAQKGHTGRNLKQIAVPDEIEVLVPTACTHCGGSLDDKEVSAVLKRQLFDLPPMQIHVKEFQSHHKRCRCCSHLNKPTFPDEVTAHVQYGPRLKSLIAYLNTYQMQPYERISETIEDLFAHKLSTGTIYNILDNYHDKLENTEAKLSDILGSEAVIHCDETGVNVRGKLHWMHVVSSSIATGYFLHKKRGKAAMDAMGILPEYNGIAVHDHWSPYNHYGCSHSFCNAHHLRELKGVLENEKALWAEDMHALLTTMNKEVYKAKEKGLQRLSRSKEAHYMKRYDTILKSAILYYPEPDKNVKKTRGRIKQPKGKNLLDRLVKYKEETLRFAVDFSVPLTNNLAERDLRMIKVKEKISGTFASFKGGEFFARIRGYISTVKKNNRNVLEELANVLAGKAYMPVGVGT